MQHSLPTLLSSTNACETCCEKQNCGGAQSELSNTPFRQAEKKYKLYQLSRREARRKPQQGQQCEHVGSTGSPVTATGEPDPFAEVVDFQNMAHNTVAHQAMMHKVVVEDPEVACYTFAGVPGLLIFPGVLTPQEQTQYSRAAILHYGDSSAHPNILSTHAKEPRETQLYQPPMRWATLGFSYQWTSKTYRRDLYSAFPRDVKEKMETLVGYVARVHQDEWQVPCPAKYQPQTAIVNYYPVGSMMMCHQDVSEEVLEQPLVSLSLGASAIFLMGTTNRSDAPYAFLLRSGDVVAFTGPARTAFHATPRILDDCPPYLTVPEDRLTPEEQSRFANHAYYQHLTPDGSFVPVDKSTMSDEERERYWRLCMRHMRININARQVYLDDCDFLYSE